MGLACMRDSWTCHTANSRHATSYPQQQPWPPNKALSLAFRGWTATVFGASSRPPAQSTYARRCCKRQARRALFYFILFYFSFSDRAVSQETCRCLVLEKTGIFLRDEAASARGSGSTISPHVRTGHTSPTHNEGTTEALLEPASLCTGSLQSSGHHVEALIEPAIELQGDAGPQLLRTSKCLSSGREELSFPYWALPTSSPGIVLYALPGLRHPQYGRLTRDVPI
ncbi:hypothetical protein VTN02DRAFT_3783 [Thermoascus thermophilus]